MSGIDDYKCPLCGAPIGYVPGSDLMHCDYCGADSPVSSFAKGAADSGFDWKGNAAAGMVRENPEHEYICKSCGAAIQSFDDAIASFCPYCGNNMVVCDETSGSNKPNLIIPFGLKADEASAVISGYLKGKRLLPSGFASAAKSGELKGVYVPFWFFDCTADGMICLHAQKETSVTRPVRASSSGSDGHEQAGNPDRSRQETIVSHYRLEREGCFEFERLPVDASKHFDDDAMDALEPFDYSKLVPFDAAYFAGHLAEKFNSSPLEENDRVASKVREGVLDYFRSHETGYDSISVEKDDMKVDAKDVKYVMLPVYALNFTFDGQNRIIYVNGQTGKVAADLPIDAGKSWKYALLTFFPVFVFACVICMFI